MTLSELLKDVNIKKIDGGGSMKISGIACDSRKVKPGNVFVCINRL